ncbi:hypothetical protein [Azospirillum palustre]
MPGKRRNGATACNHPSPLSMHKSSAGSLPVLRPVRLPMREPAGIVRHC